MRSRTIVLTAAIGLATACGGSGGDGQATGFQEIYDLGATEYVGQIPPESRNDDGRWVRYLWPEGAEARCMSGSRFRTDLRPSDSGNLVIFLLGGGACLPDLCATNPTAIPGGSYFDLSALMRLEVDGQSLSTWDLALVPYCDGSLMAGNADLDSDGDGTVDRYHRGIQNLSAGFDVTAAEFPDPERIILTGVSGGAYSTIAATFLARNAWPGVPIDVINDAGVGLGRPGEPEFIEGLLAHWGIDVLIPPSCTDCTGDGHVTNLIQWQLRRDPNLRVGMLSSYEDVVIGDVFLGIDGARFREAVSSEMRELAAAFPGRCEHFLYDGIGHTLLAIGLEGQTAGGVPGPEWLRAMLENDGWTSTADP